MRVNVMLSHWLTACSREPSGSLRIPARILTEVEHRWDEAPSDDELSTLEQLLEPLLGLFAQFSHDFLFFFKYRNTTTPAFSPRTKTEEVTQLTSPNVEVPLP